MSPAISAETRIAGVVGHPVRHSLSPLIHNAWIAAAGLDAAYLAFAPSEDGLEALVQGLRGQVALGLNVTIPFKERAFALADQRSPAAERAGAANLLVFRADGGVFADNTDGAGLLAALDEAGALLTSGPVAVLGAGGAARAAVLGLLDAGASQVRLINRSRERAEAIAALDGRVSVLGWDDAPQALGGVAAVINATSLGMTGQPSLELSLDHAPPAAVVMDMVYRPLKTGLLKAAEARGNPTADGLSMLIAQARPSFEALFGRPPPADVDVRALCEQALGRIGMIVLGLTGSIGMGKSTTAGLFAEEGAWVHDADRTVHTLYAQGGEAVGPIGEAFPAAIKDDAVDRKALAAALGQDTRSFERLEAIVHPLVAMSRDRFVEAAQDAGAEVVVLDVPLLFETGGHERLDAVVVVSAPHHVQRQRVLGRPGMTAEKFESLLGRQVSDAEKRARADFVVDTGQGVEHARAQVREILATVTHPRWRPPRDLADPRERSH